MTVRDNCHRADLSSCCPEIWTTSTGNRLELVDCRTEGFGTLATVNDTSRKGWLALVTWARARGADNPDWKQQEQYYEQMDRLTRTDDE
jgi:hypothetical protein